MKKVIFTFLFISIIQFSYSQEVVVLDNVAISVKKCLLKYQDTINEENQNTFIKECLENATEEHMSLLLKHYKIASFKQISLKTYVVDLIPYISKQCSLKEEKLKKVFAKWMK